MRPQDFSTFFKEGDHPSLRKWVSFCQTGLAFWMEFDRDRLIPGREDLDHWPDLAWVLFCKGYRGYFEDKCPDPYDHWGDNFLNVEYGWPDLRAYLRRIGLTHQAQALYDDLCLVTVK